MSVDIGGTNPYFVRDYGWYYDEEPEALVGVWADAAGILSPTAEDLAAWEQAELDYLESLKHEPEDELSDEDLAAHVASVNYTVNLDFDEEEHFLESIYARANVAIAETFEAAVRNGCVVHGVKLA